MHIEGSNSYIHKIEIGKLILLVIVKAPSDWPCFFKPNFPLRGPKKTSNNRRLTFIGTLSLLKFFFCDQLRKGPNLMYKSKKNKSKAKDIRVGYLEGFYFECF